MSHTALRGLPKAPRTVGLRRITKASEIDWSDRPLAEKIHLSEKASSRQSFTFPETLYHI